eukprot:6212181-Pleurochrysis_carterae.AAC.1
MLSARGGERERERKRARERERLKKETPRLTFSAFLFGKRSAAAGRAATHLTDFWLHQQVVDDSIQASGIVASRLLMRRRQCVENAGARDGGFARRVEAKLRGVQIRCGRSQTVSAANAHRPKIRAGCGNARARAARCTPIIHNGKQYYLRNLSVPYYAPLRARAAATGIRKSAVGCNSQMR